MTPEHLSMEEKTELRRRLMREGRWKAFVKRREGLKEKDGLNPQDAWAAAAKEFAKPLEEIEPSLMEKTLEREAKREKASKKEKDRKGLWDDPIPVLKMSEGTTEWYTDNDWIGRNLGVKDVDYSKAPSSFAAFTLWRCRTDMDAMNAWYKDCYPRMAPSSRQIDSAASERIDDGRRQIDSVGHILKIRRKYVKEEGPRPRPMTLAEVNRIPSVAEKEGTNG